MNRLLHKCKACQMYTLESKCPRCGSDEVATPHPPKFSPDDRYLRYRVHERYETEEKRKSQA